jgi:hypothetical protein
LPSLLRQDPRYLQAGQEELLASYDKFVPQS